MIEFDNLYYYKVQKILEWLCEQWIRIDEDTWYYYYHNIRVLKRHIIVDKLNIRKNDKASQAHYYVKWLFQKDYDHSKWLHNNSLLFDATIWPSRSLTEDREYVDYVLDHSIEDNIKYTLECRDRLWNLDFPSKYMRRNKLLYMKKNKLL